MRSDRPKVDVRAEKSEDPITFHSSGQFREKSDLHSSSQAHIQTLIEPAIDRSKNIARASARRSCFVQSAASATAALSSQNFASCAFCQCDRVYQALFPPPRRSRASARQGEECLGP